MTGRPRIMLVEDSLTVRAVLGEMLSRAGFEVDGAGDAAEAMELLGHRRFDVVIADYQLPRMTGLELLPPLRGAHPRASLILRSAGVGPELVAQARAFRVAAVLEKPVAQDRLVEAVRTALEDGAESRGARSRTKRRDGRPGYARLPGIRGP